MIDPFDDDFDGPHLDPEEINSDNYNEGTLREILTAFDKGFVGVYKPKVESIKVYTIEDSPVGMFEDSDNMANDPEQADLDDIHE